MTINKVKNNNLFSSGKSQPFKLSRSKLELFMDCQRCFYLDRKMGVARPPMFPYTLNNAVDALMKKEFDIHRIKQQSHPMMATYGIDAIPWQHPNMDKWRHNFTGIQYLHPATNWLIYGAVDDVWINKQEELMIVDYKATSSENEISLADEYRQSFKRQMEIYQWLFRRNGFSVSDIGYFVYANGKKDRRAFDGRLDFDVQIIPYQGDDSWVEETIIQAKQCLTASVLPAPSSSCGYCDYRQAAKKVEK